VRAQPPATPGKPPNPVAETPFAVAETEEAVTVPFFSAAPCTTTVSPGRRAPFVDVAFRVTVVAFVSFTLTSEPSAAVTQSVLPWRTVRVPAGAAVHAAVASGGDTRTVVERQTTIASASATTNGLSVHQI
jgi:hypothetical protein